ncbi:2-amino-4-hydroxy-6-hydroxymethyldihydropteridine diphosphokinase [Peribacillus sp. JNUCC 23]|uniref:2-amino-4-hydroxy-6- hydroxymethyldihydropteridine diphosphokinase n=1 Tax=Peribacillus sp. NPDC096379 TaxID=3364393 RepID=UPI0007837885
MENYSFLSIGSNVGDRSEYIKEAIRLLHEEKEVKVLQTSSLYETAPIGYIDQPQFLNAVILVNTGLSAVELLNVCQEIERKLGRKREIRWGPRTLDLDILLYNHENIETERLSVPHPRMVGRAFVLVPLLEINPTIMLPTTDTPLNDILEKLEDKEGVQLWKQKSGEGAYALFEN